jgi:hypothetical protein
VSVFHSQPYASLIALLNSSGLIAGDLYYTTDTQILYIALTNSEGNVGIAATGAIMTGNIQLGFSGAQGPEGPEGPTGPTGPQGPAGSGSTNNIATESGNYTTQTSDDSVFCTGTSPQTITLTTAGIASGKTYDVKVMLSAKQAAVVSQNGELIDGQTSVTLYFGDAAQFTWSGSAWIIE